MLSKRDAFELSFKVVRASCNTTGGWQTLQMRRFLLSEAEVFEVACTTASEKGGRLDVQSLIAWAVAALKL